MKLSQLPLLRLLVASSILSTVCMAWSPVGLSKTTSRCPIPSSVSVCAIKRPLDDITPAKLSFLSAPLPASRRSVFSTAFSAFLAASTISTLTTTSKDDVAWAAADDDVNSKVTIYRTGKAPLVPGEKPKNKDDTKGTKKDPNFLRSIADCKNQCQNTAMPDGLARSKEDCLSECQDICCTTYEQCTFAITPRL